jgi:hypothetical protein
MRIKKRFHSVWANKLIKHSKQFCRKNVQNVENLSEIIISNVQLVLSMYMLECVLMSSKCNKLKIQT